jgi:hypothetical protein
MSNLRLVLLAAHTGIGNTLAVILVIPDAGLAQLAASSALLAATWPRACEEIKFLLQVLRMSVPSLAEALALGVMSVLAPGSEGEASTSVISLVHRAVVLTAVARDEAGNQVTMPHLRPAEVQQLEVTGLVAGGRSWLRLAG